MKRKDGNISKKSTKSTFSTVMYVLAATVGTLGVALLINNLLLFKSSVTQYVTQGYAVGTVIKQLLTAQLLPGIFEPIAMYGGIAFILLGIGKVNKKVSKCLMLLTKVEVGNDIIEESIVKQNVAEGENTATSESTQTM